MNWLQKPTDYGSNKPEIEELLDGSLFWSDFIQVSTLLSSFSCFWTMAIEIKVLKEEDSSLLSLLYCYSLQQHIYLAFCNDFGSGYCMFAFILFRSETLLVLQQHHRSTCPILHYCSVLAMEKSGGLTHLCLPV